jgi:UDP-N-acetylglucosamine--N-acetylmuramyl-(pentapeptide) pyrophosphoryl-undecaprenol N-acetylglucosamine transferase
MLRLLVSAGGTGGGVYPALAIVAALRARAEVLWVGGVGGMEASLVQRAGIAFTAVPAAGIHGVGPRQLPGNLLRLARGVPAARQAITRFQPDVLLFTGGYVGVPVALAAGRRPKVVYVPDLEPGLALKFVSRGAAAVCVTAEESRSFYPASQRIVISGYPVRADLRSVGQAEARARLGLDPVGPVLLISGGSRGARSINAAVWSCLEDLLQSAQVVHVTGELDWPRVEAVRQRLEGTLGRRYHPYAYLHEEMGLALASADLAVARAGASALGELPLFGLPAALVPYPYAWRYQKLNARHLARSGAAVVLEDAALGVELLPTVRALLRDAGRLRDMSEAARRLSRPEAAHTIAAELERAAGRRTEAHD